MLSNVASIKFDLQTWAALLGILAVLIAAGQMWDRHYLKSKTSNRIRDAIIWLYLLLEEPLPWSEIGSVGLAFLNFLVPLFGFYGGILYVARLISEELFDFLLVLGIGMGVMLGFALLCSMLLLVLFLAVLLYKVIHFFLEHIFDKMSDPRVSPFTYLLTSLGLITAIGKAAIDIVKAL